MERRPRLPGGPARAHRGPAPRRKDAGRDAPGLLRAQGGGEHARERPRRSRHWRSRSARACTRSCVSRCWSPPSDDFRVEGGIHPDQLEPRPGVHRVAGVRLEGNFAPGADLDPRRAGQHGSCAGRWWTPSATGSSARRSPRAAGGLELAPRAGPRTDKTGSYTVARADAGRYRVTATVGGAVAPSKSVLVR